MTTRKIAVEVLRGSGAGCGDVDILRRVGVLAGFRHMVANVRP